MFSYRLNKTDLITEFILYSFRERTRRMVDEIFFVEGEFVVEDAVENDEVLCQIMHGLAMISKYNSSEIIYSLFKWRRNQILETNQIISRKKIVRDSVYYEQCISLFVEYVFSRSLMTTCEHLAVCKLVLDDSCYLEIESTCFAHFTQYKKDADNPTEGSDLKVANSREIRSFYEKIIGVLSGLHLSKIASGFIKNCSSISFNNKKIISYILCMKRVCLHMNTQKDVSSSIALISFLFEMFYGTVRMDIKAKISNFISQLLDSVVFGSELDCKKKGGSDDWYVNMLKHFNNKSFHPKKRKIKANQSIMIPLGTSLLCSLDSANFEAKFLDWLITIQLSFEKPYFYGMESLLFLLENYCVKVCNFNYNEELLSITKDIIFAYFFNVKKNTVKNDNYLDFIIEIILIMSCIDFKYTMDDVIFKIFNIEFFTLKQKSTTNQNIFSIFRNTESVASTTSYQSSMNLEKLTLFVCTMDRLYHKKINITDDGLRPHAIGGQTEMMSCKFKFKDYLKTLQEYWANIIIYLDSLYEQTFNLPLKSNESSNRLERESIIKILKPFLGMMHAIIPKMPIENTINFLVKYFAYQDSEINKLIIKILYFLISRKSNLIITILKGFIGILITIKQNKFELIEDVLSIFDKTIGFWIELHREENYFSFSHNEDVVFGAIDELDEEQILDDKSIFKEECEEENLECLFQRIQTILLTFFGSFKMQIRSLVAKILTKLKSISEIVISNSGNTGNNSGFFIDVIRTNEGDILSLLDQYCTLMKIDAPSRVLNSIDRLMSVDGIKYQVYWSQILGIIAKKIFCTFPNSALVCCELVQNYLSGFMPEVNSNCTLADQDPALFLWRNNMILLCAALSSSCKDEKAEDGKKKTLMSIIAYLKSSNEFYRKASVMALQNIHTDSINVLFNCIKAFDEKLNIPGEKRRKTKIDYHKYDVMLIYHYLVCFNNPSTICKFFGGIMSFLNYIYESLISEPNIFDNSEYVEEACSFFIRICELSCKKEWDDLKVKFLHFFISLCSDKAVLKYIGGGAYNSNVIQEGYSKTKERPRSSEMKNECLCMLLRAIDTCLRHSVFVPILSHKIFRFVDNYLKSANEDFKRLSRLILQSYSSKNVLIQVFFDLVLKKCYDLNSVVSTDYFLLLTHLTENESFTRCPLYVLIHLIIMMLGYRRPSVRKTAIDFLIVTKLFNLPSSPSDKDGGIVWDFNLGSLFGPNFLINYKGIQYQVSEKLASMYPELAPHVFNEMRQRFKEMSQETRNSMMNSIVPWLEKINLSTKPFTIAQNSLYNLLYLTFKYFNKFIKEIEDMWNAIVKIDTNVEFLINELLIISAGKDIQVIKTVSFLISNMSKKHPNIVVSSLIAQLYKLELPKMCNSNEESKNNFFKFSIKNSVSEYSLGGETASSYANFLSLRKCKSEVVLGRSNSCYTRGLIHFNAGLINSFIQLISTSSWKITNTQLILIIISQLCYELSSFFREKLHFILHLLIINIDNPSIQVYEYCRITIVNIVHSLIFIPLKKFKSTSIHHQKCYINSLNLIEYLKSHHNEYIWTFNENLTCTTKIESPKINPASLVNSIVSCCPDEDLAKKWASIALEFAINKNTWHHKKRSFQVFRALKPQIDNACFHGLIEYLSDSIRKMNDSVVDNNFIVIEILVTLRVLVRTQMPRNVNFYVKVFFIASIMLYTDFEKQFVADLKLLNETISKLDFHDRVFKQNFLAQLIPLWDADFEGIQQLITRGFFSSVTEIHSVKTILNISNIPFENLLFPRPGKLLHFIVCLLPHICSVFYKNKNEKIKTKMIFALDKLANEGFNQSLEKISIVLTDFINGKYSQSMNQFIEDICKPLAQNLLSNEERTPSDATEDPSDSSIKFFNLSENARGVMHSKFGFNEALAFLFQTVDSSMDYQKEAALTIIETLLRNKCSLSPTSINAKSDGHEKILKQKWIDILLELMPTDHWRHALNILEIEFEHSSITIANLDPFLIHSNYENTKLFYSLPDRQKQQTTYFFNKPDIGMVNISKKLNILSKKGPSKPVVNDPILPKMAEQNNPDPISRNNLDQTQQIPEFIRTEFPCFEGFDELLKKVDSTTPLIDDDS